jgi:CheY-like chemotaxis protein
MPTSFRPLRVLYVEDDPGLRELIVDVLGSEGHQVDTAVDGQDGLQRLLEPSASYDLVLTDIRMPIMSGLEMVRHLQGTAFQAPIILFSAYDADLYAAESAGLTIAANVTKGDMQKLIETIAAIAARDAA